MSVGWAMTGMIVLVVRSLLLSAVLSCADGMWEGGPSEVSGFGIDSGK